MSSSRSKQSKSLGLETLEPRYNPSDLMGYSAESDGGNHHLYLIDLVNGNVTDVGDLANGAQAFTDVEGLAFQPNTNNLYGVDDTTKDLIKINLTATGNVASVVVVGSLALPPAVSGLQLNPGLRFDNAGHLFMSTDEPTAALFQINVSTGAATAVGPQGEAIFGLAFNANTGIMYGVGDTTLATINLATGAATNVGNLTNVIGTQGDIDSDPTSHTIYGITDGTHGPAVVYTVDPTTGLATVVVGTQSGHESLAIPFVPPSPPPPGPPPTPPPPGPPPVPPVVVSGLPLVVGAGPGATPLVRVFDSGTGALLTQFYAYGLSYTGGVNVAVGDVTGDGVPDIVTAPASGGGSDVRVFTLNGSLESNFLAYPGFYGGVSVAVGDVTGDGVGDIITGAGKGGGPNVKVFEGKDFKLVDNFFAYDPRFQDGIAVAAADFNKDGKADIVTAPENGGGADVRVFQDGNVAKMTSFLLADPSYRGGISIAAGPLDADGTLGLVAGTASGGDTVAVFTLTPNGSQFIKTLVRTIEPYGRFTGGIRVGLVPRADGGEDIVTGTQPGGGPHVRVFSSANGAARLDFLAFPATFQGGAFVEV